MENYKTKIEEVLTQALTEKTFSLEIIEKIKSLKDGFETSQLLIKNKDEQIVELKKTEVAYNEVCKKLEEYRTREKEIKDKETALEKTLYELDFERKRANELKEVMMIAFRNPTLMENSSRNYYDASGNYRTDNSSSTKSIN